MEDNYKIRVGITHGDINGVGYEVILKTFSDPTMLEPVSYTHLGIFSASSTVIPTSFMMDATFSSVILSKSS